MRSDHRMISDASSTEAQHNSSMTSSWIRRSKLLSLESLQLSWRFLGKGGTPGFFMVRDGRGVETVGLGKWKKIGIQHEQILGIGHFQMFGTPIHESNTIRGVLGVLDVARYGRDWPTGMNIRVEPTRAADRRSLRNRFFQCQSVSQYIFDRQKRRKYL